MAQEKEATKDQLNGHEGGSVKEHFIVREEKPLSMSEGKHVEGKSEKVQLYTLLPRGASMHKEYGSLDLYDPSEAWEKRREDPYDCMAFEFQPENVAPYHEDSRLFVMPQWPCLSWFHFVVYRVVMAVLITVWVIIDFLDEAYHFYSDNYGIWFVFATNWSFLLLSVSAVIRAVAAVHSFSCARRYDPNDEEERPKPTRPGMMALWMVYNMAANGAIVVTFSYWTFLTAFDNSGFLTTTMSELKHSLNSAYILLDLAISATPIRIFHLVYPMFVGAVYTVFNALYFINNGVGPDGKPYAYYVMDWRNPIESAVTCSLGFILTTVMQVFLYGLYRLRLMAYSALVRRERRRKGQNPDAPPCPRPSQPDPEAACDPGESQGILTPTPGTPLASASYKALDMVEMVETKTKMEEVEESVS